MKIETQIQEDQQARLKVTFDDDLVEQAKHKAARKLASKAKIPGFRPGKAPYAVIVRQFGEATILEEAVEIIVDEHYARILQQAEVQPYGPGSLEKVESVNPLSLEFLVPLRPEVELGDYRSVRIPYEAPQVDDAMMERQLQSLRERSAVIEPVQRPIQANDMVVLRISAFLAQQAEGTQPTLLEEKFMPFLVAQNEAEDEWPFKGFSSHLLGLTESEEKTVTFSFPHDHASAAFRGKEVEFRFKVESIKQRKLPELNDEFAASFEGIHTLEELRQAVREDLSRHLKDEYDDEYIEKVLEALIAQAQIKYPPQLVEEEAQSIINSLEEDLRKNNLTIEIYLKTRNITREELEKEARLVAEKNIRKALVINKVAELEGIVVDDAEIQQLSQSAIDNPDFREYVRAGLKREKALKRLVEIASGLVEATESVNDKSGSELAPSTEQTSSVEDEQVLPSESIELQQNHSQEE